MMVDRLVLLLVPLFAIFLVPPLLPFNRTKLFLKLSVIPKQKCQCILTVEKLIPVPIANMVITITPVNI